MTTIDRHGLQGLVICVALLAAFPVHGDPITIEDAIRGAWKNNPGLRAARSAFEAASADAGAAAHGGFPTLGVSVRGVSTDEPLMAFGMKLDQGQVTPQDFDPSRLNHPATVTGFAAGATLTQPIYAGGRIGAGRVLARAQADAEEASFEARRSDLALRVVEAYFGTQAATEGLRYAEEELAHARETEHFVRARSAQGLMLEADVARATAFRAQAEAERAAAEQRAAEAHSGLVLLVGKSAADAALSTPLSSEAGPVPEGDDPSSRPSLRAVRLQRDAAEAGTEAARGSLLPSVGAQVSLGTAVASGFDSGNAWFSLGLLATWDLSLADRDRFRAAQARAAAAAEASEWEYRQAEREVEEERRAITTSSARLGSAEEALSASESALKLRRARYEQGLLPLTDELDAETALAGARALLLQARLEARIARARLAVALGQPVEGV